MKYRDFRWVLAAGGLALGMGFSACAVTGSKTGEPGASEHSALSALPERFERTVPWGSGEGELTLRPGVSESISYGPNAAAVTEHGVLLLDWLAGRVVLVDHEHSPRTLATVAEDSEDLVAGADGAFVTYSPVRARARFFSPDGVKFGELALPRALRDGVRLDLGLSRRLVLTTGYQEQITLGSPSAPLPLSVSLRGKKEGAHLLPDGRGVVVRVEDGVGTVQVVTQATENERSTVSASVELPGTMSAARIIGGTGSLVCLRVEAVSSAPKVSVDRRAVCLNAVSGKIVLDQALPPVGLYLPRTELAFGAGRLAFIRPVAAGLEVSSFRVSREEAK